MSTVTPPTPTANDIGEFDSQRHESFGVRVIGMLNEASLTFMLSIGHRSGLLDSLKRMNRSATAHEIADEAGLERAIRPRMVGRAGH